MKDSNIKKALKILEDGGLISSDNFGMLYNNQAAEESEYLKDKKTSVFTRIGAGVGAVAAGVGGVLASPFTGGASIAAAVPIVTALGKHAIGGKPERGQNSDPMKDLGLAAVSGVASGAAAYAGAGGFDSGNVPVLSDADWASISQGVDAENFNTDNLGFEAISQFKSGGRMYANGGSTSFTSTQQSNGLIVLQGNNHGGGGIDLMDGIEVEGGETIYNDFVFTNSHVIPFDLARRFNLPQGTTGKTFAAASKHYAKYLDERPDDPHAKESFAEHMGRLEEAHLDAVPQSRPENIEMASNLSNIVSKGIPAKNGGKIMWYVNSLPFKNGGSMKYKYGGEPPVEPPVEPVKPLVDQDTSNRAFDTLDQILRAQFGPAKLHVPGRKTQGVDGTPGLDMPQYAGVEPYMAEIRDMTDLDARNQSIADVWNMLWNENIAIKAESFQDLDIDMTALDNVSYNYPIRSSISNSKPPPTSVPSLNYSSPSLGELPSVNVPKRDSSLVNVPNANIELITPNNSIQNASTLLGLPLASAPQSISDIGPTALPAISSGRIQRQPGLTPEQIAAVDKVINAGIKADATLDKAKAKKLRNDKLMEGMRYAPIAGDLAALLTTGLSKPETIAAEQFLIKQDYKRQHIDKELLQREADQQTADLTYQLSGLSTTQAGLMSSLAAISSGTAKAKTDAVMKGQLFDAEQGQMAEQYSRQKEMANSQTMLQIQNMNDANNAAWSDNLSDSVTNLTQNIGAIGKDEMNKNIANRLGAYNIYGQFVNPEMAPVTDILGLIGNLNEAQQTVLLQGLTKKNKSSTTPEQ